MKNDNYERVIAFGDIHGCINALDALLDAIEPTERDLLVSLGDFVDSGRETKEVIDRLLELEAKQRLIALMGNHEEMLLGSLKNPKLRDSWLLFGGVSTVNSYRFEGDIEDIPSNHLDFIRRCRNYHETDTHIFVHAGYEPHLPMAEQSTHDLRWRLLEEPLPEPHVSGKTVVLGHTEQRSGNVLDAGHLVCLDTFAYGYGWLSAMDTVSGQIWQASRWGVLRTPEDTPTIDVSQLLKVPTPSPHCR